MPAHPPAELAHAARPLPWLQALVLGLAGAACYANSLDVPFLFDDPSPGVALEYDTRPLVALSFALNRAWSGYETWSYHLLNVLVHLAAGLLLLGVLRRGMAAAVPALAVGRREGLAFATTLLWLCHPLQTSAVTYLSQRAESLSVAFYLAHLYAFLRAAAGPRARAWQALALAALALGLATKELVATAPGVALLFDVLFLHGRAPTPAALWHALRLRPAYYGATALVTLGLAGLFVAPALLEDDTMAFGLEGIGALDYLCTQPGVLLHYLRLALWPHPLCFDYGWPIARAPGDWLAQSLWVLALLAASLVLAWRRSWIGFLGLAFFLVLAPTSSFVPIQDAAFEHRMYLPLAVPLLLGVAGVTWCGARLSPWLPRALLGAAALAYGLATVRRNQDYREPLTLLRETVALAPHHARAHLYLGTLLLDAGQIEEAQAALREGLLLDPSNAYGYLNLGKTYLHRDEFERALPFLQRAAELEDDPRIADTLGGALFLAGQPERSLAHFERALEANPDFAPTHARLAQSLAALGRNSEAIQHNQEALRLDPRLPAGHQQLATLFLAEGRAAEALEHAEAVCTLVPAAPEGPYLCAQALRALGRFAEALASLRATLALAPELPEPHAELAQTVARWPAATEADRREALRHAEEACALAGGARPELLLIQAEAEAGLGEHARAVATLERALALPAAARQPALAEALRGRRSEYAQHASAPDRPGD